MQRTRAVIEGPGVVLAPDGRIRFFNSHRKTRVERPSKWWLVRNGLVWMRARILALEDNFFRMKD